MRMPEADDTPELSRVSSSDFLGCKAVLALAVVLGGGEAGMEKPMTEDVGRLDEPGVRRREAHDFWAGFAAGAGVGTADVEASAVADADGTSASTGDSDGTGASAGAGFETSGSTVGSAEIEVDGSAIGSFGSGAEVEVSDIVEGSPLT
jgi:hypothetical protein